MVIDKTENYIHIKPSNISIKEFAFELKNYLATIDNNHLIIDISEKINIKTKDLFIFLDLSISQQTNGTSFVIVCKGIDIDKIPDEINVVPTFEEALDVLEMDEIERKLGF